MYKIKPMNRKVLVEKIASAEANENFANEYGIVIPKLESISKKKALSEGKYLWKQGLLFCPCVLAALPRRNSKFCCRICCRPALLRHQYRYDQNE
jgi:hypothetical protein